MKKLSPFRGTWPPLLAPAPANMGTATAALPHPQAINCIPAVIAALGICGSLGLVSLLVPPFIDWDSANGFLAWRGTVLGALNSVITPDRADIARDTAGFLTVWSPGQYLLPGAISLLGVPLGIALTLTVASGLLASLIGWVMVVRRFAPRTSSALLTVVLIGLFHYSTHAFSTYHGGEILLQATTPWLILAACRVPEIEAAPAALLAAVAVFCAFIAKLTGLIVVAAALISGSAVSFAFSRRITRGMIGGLFGTLAANAILYAAFFSRGPTAVSATNWHIPLDNIAFALLAPWVAGFSWSDPVSLIFFPHRNIFVLPAGYLGFLLPAALLASALVLLWRPQTGDAEKFKLFSLCFYGMVTAAFILIFIHGGVISVEERHFRSAGTLLIVCGIISASGVGPPRWIRGLFLAVCAVMASYGLASFSYHEFATAKGQFLDRTSWTNQRIFDAAAIEFTRQLYGREGRAALFVLPSYQLAVTFPVDARILPIDLNSIGDREKIVGLYSGRVGGHLVVLVPHQICDTSNGCAVLAAFKEYPPTGWKRMTFAGMSVYLQ